MKKTIYYVRLLILTAGIFTQQINEVYSLNPVKGEEAIMVNAKATTYYINSKTGNDSNTGTSAEKPWQSVNPVNSTIFKPGDKILFNAGTRYVGHLAPKGSGRENSPIVMGKYGAGEKPLIEGLGQQLETILLHNVEYWEVKDLEITNQGTERQANRAGVRVKLDNFGTAHNISLRNLKIRDVNGSLVKSEGGGTGVTCDNGGDKIKSRFDGLLIEDCHLIRTDRDAIAIRSEHKDRNNNWFPNLNVVIRRNLLEDFGGDGIVPRGCSGTLIEYNKLINGRTRCNDYAAGIWPHSSDSTIIQFNDVSYMRGILDGMAFDSDGNCRYTLFQYNYSHDNDGGFLMVCGGSTNKGTIIRYNISQNDKNRVLYITGPVEDVEFYNNVIYLGEGLNEYAFWPGGGKKPGDFALNFTFANNILYFKGTGRYNLGGISTKNITNNYFFGNHTDLPKIPGNFYNDPGLKNPGTGGDGLGSLEGYKLVSGSPCIDAGITFKNLGTRDFEGNKVPTGKKPDIGAFEKHND